MRLDGISSGDLILCEIKGRLVYGEVLEIASGQVNFRPLCPAAGRYHAAARDVVSHWRKAHRHRGGSAHTATDAK